MTVILGSYVGPHGNRTASLASSGHYLPTPSPRRYREGAQCPRARPLEMGLSSQQNHGIAEGKVTLSTMHWNPTVD